MSNIAAGQRTGRGLLALRKRYIRRAEFLSMDKSFRECMESVRAKWNKQHPDFSVTLEDSGPTEPYQPLTLIRALDAGSRSMYSIVAEFQSEAKARELEAVLNEGGRSAKTAMYTDSPAWSDSADWGELVHHLGTWYFPEWDFPAPYIESSEHHPGPFIAASILGDPRRLSGECEQLILPISLEPHGIPGDAESDKGMSWYLPLYPGMTVQDLRDAAPGIIRSVNDIYRANTPEVRIIALRHEGLTHKAIADHLGLTEQTVAATLRDANILTTKNA